LNFLLGALALQWSMFVLAFFQAVNGDFIGDPEGTRYLRLSITSIISGDFCVASVLIAFGSTMGKTNTLQLFTMMILMVPLYGVNGYIGLTLLGAVDMGGSIFVHIFGCYFGLAFAYVVTNRQAADKHKDNTSLYYNDITAMIGTLFLWMFCPSFNGALALGSQQHRVIINTILSLTGACVFSYMASYVLRHERVFCMVDIQNATLAGGVAVGSSSDLVIQPWGALLIGAIAGTLSVVGYTKIQPFLEKKIGLYDTAGINNLHGMPGIMGGIGGAFSALAAGETAYGYSIGIIFHNRAPRNATEAALLGVKPGKGYTAAQQCGIQFAATGITLLIGTAGGLFAGAVAKFPFCDPLNKDEMFDDSINWEVPADYGLLDKVNKAIKKKSKS